MFNRAGIACNRGWAGGRTPSGWQGQHLGGDLRRDGDRYECDRCGTVLRGVSPETKVRIVLVRASGQANVRVIYADGAEVHRCDDGPRR